MREITDRIIYGYERLQSTNTHSVDAYRDDLTMKNQELGAPDFSSMTQVHGNHIETARGGVIHEATDGLVTDHYGLILYGRFADCLPIIVWDETRPLIGIAHAGWQGTAGRISLRLVEHMINLGAKKLRAWIGPGICLKHYQVSPGFELQVQPMDSRSMVIRNQDHFFDLKQENRSQLEVYLKAEAIEVSDICTYEDSDYYSYRRDKAERGRNIGYIMLK